jgi:hypothetical protein
VSERNEPGRPPALDETKQAAVCAVLAMGGTRTIAASYVGCHPDTIRNTELRDEAFAAALEAAESKHEVLQLSYINSAGKEGRYWRAAAWVLEHRYPTRYGARRQNLFTLEQTSYILAQFAEVILDEVTDDEQRQKILARLAELTAGLQASEAGGQP